MSAITSSIPQPSTPASPPPHHHHAKDKIEQRLPAERNDDKAEERPGIDPLQAQKQPTSEDVPGSRLRDVFEWCTTTKSPALLNTGSVARDHLANERTYLAWLRTSITLASIGIVIAQLFRLSSSRFTLPSDWSGLPANLTDLPASIPSSEIPQVLASLQAASERQDRILEVLLQAQDDDRKRYDRLGKPVGAVFLAISVLYVLGGTYRYISVHHFLTGKNYFPPARRSIMGSSLAMLALASTTFSLIFILR